MGWCLDHLHSHVLQVAHCQLGNKEALDHVCLIIQQTSQLPSTVVTGFPRAARQQITVSKVFSTLCFLTFMNQSESHDQVQSQCERILPKHLHSGKGITAAIFSQTISPYLSLDSAVPAPASQKAHTSLSETHKSIIIIASGLKFRIL